MPDTTMEKNRNQARNKTHAGAQALMRAVESGDAAEAQRLIAAGAAADAPVASGETALMVAAAKGFTDVAQVLLDGGAEVNAKRNDGFTPLLVAVFYGHEEMARLLLERGADKSERTRHGSTAEAWAAAHGFASVAALLKNMTPVRAPAPAPRPASRAIPGVMKTDESLALENVGAASSVASRMGIRVAPMHGAARAETLGNGAASHAARSTPETTKAERVPPVMFQLSGVSASRSRGVWRATLALVAIAGVALCLFIWRAKSSASAGSQPPIAPASGASNETALPAPPPAIEASSNAEPTPTGMPLTAPNRSNPPLVNLPEEMPPTVSTNTTSHSSASSPTEPAVVAEDGSSASENKSTRGSAAIPADRQAARAADGEVKEEKQGESAPAANDPERTTQGPGAEVRTAAPARPSLPPSSTATDVTPPMPSPAPKRKVIQWP
jgi:hypothetical protein